MLGDLLLTIRKFIKQQTCLHDYKFIPDKVFMKFDYYQCKKCCKSKKA